MLTYDLHCLQSNTDFRKLSPANQPTLVCYIDRLLHHAHSSILHQNTDQAKIHSTDERCNIIKNKNVLHKTNYNTRQPQKNTTTIKSVYLKCYTAFDLLATYMLPFIYTFKMLMSVKYQI
jgi:hypothetical protein